MRKLTDLAEIADALTEIIDIARRMRGAYHRFPPSSARERRRYEQRNSAELVRFEYAGHLYEAGFETVCSCKNVYARSYYAVDGNKCTLRQLTACLKAINANLERGD